FLIERALLDRGLWRQAEAVVAAGKQPRDLQLQRTLRHVGELRVVLRDRLAHLPRGFRTIARVDEVRGCKLQLEQQVGRCRRAGEDERVRVDAEANTDIAAGEDAAEVVAAVFAKPAEDEGVAAERREAGPRRRFGQLAGTESYAHRDA